MKLKELCSDEQPREKMLEKGASALTNAELLAILLRTGDGKLNAVEICRDLLKRASESLCQLSDWSVDRLQEINGIGPAKALTVAATFELARRWFSEKSHLSESTITNPLAACRLLHPHLRSLSHEESWIIYLNRNNAVEGLEQLTSGTLTATTFDTRGIVRRAIEKNACSVILSHNHPSGDPRPGQADIECTHRIREALRAFEINLLDHIVISDGCFFSFADEKIYPID